VCGALQCVAVYCSVLQCGPGTFAKETYAELWQHLVGSLNLYVFFAKEASFRRSLQQKRPRSLEIQLISNLRGPCRVAKPLKIPNFDRSVCAKQAL